jgi:hypothetical protein
MPNESDVGESTKPHVGGLRGAHRAAAMAVPLLPSLDTQWYAVEEARCRPWWWTLGCRRLRPLRTSGARRGGACLPPPRGADEEGDVFPSPTDAWGPLLGNLGKTLHPRNAGFAEIREISFQVMFENDSRICLLHVNMLSVSGWSNP